MTLRLFPAALIAVLLAFDAAAADYPSCPIRVIVPFSAGSATDIIARLVAPKLTESWGQQVVIDNRPSAGGTVAGSIVATSAPDGHTLMFTNSGFAGSAALYEKLPYDPLNDFSGVTLLAVTPLVLIVATTDTMSGRIQYYISPVLPAVPLIRSGRVLALGVTSAQRLPMLQDVPTIAEAAIPGFEYEGWYGVFVASRTPRIIVNHVSREVGRSLLLPDVHDKIASTGALPRPTTPEEFDRKVREEIAMRGKIFKASGAKVE